MAQLRPFRGLRSRDDLAESVIAPPYDVMSEQEARQMVADCPTSFLRVTRSEVDLPAGSDAHGAEAYAMARSTLDRMATEGTLGFDEKPSYYLYSQTWRGQTQVGLLALASCDEYARGLIKKHELTRPDKEQDRVDHIQALDAHTGLVFLAYRDQPQVRAAIDEARKGPVAWEVDTDDGVTHRLQVVAEPGLVTRIQEAFAAVPALYIADGHHRAAAASRVAQARQGAGGSGSFLVGVFPDTELQILAYNRLVSDLNGLTPSAFISKLEEHFEVKKGADPVPSAKGQWTVYLEGDWYGLTALPGVVPDDPVGCLDVSVLQDRVLGPLLGIADPRRDQRIRFVGGIRGAGYLSGAVDAGDAAVGFHLFPTSMAELFSVADADELMPPKSTWFEPKLRSGVVVNRLG